MGGSKVLIVVIYFVAVVFSSFCSASNSWKKYSFNPSWALLAGRGAVKVNSDLEVIPTISRHGGNPIESILIKLPQELVLDSLPSSLILYARNGWHSKKLFEFYLKGIYLYAKENPSRVVCDLNDLCKVNYSLIPFYDTRKADSYFDHMLANSDEYSSYVSNKLLKSDQWNPALLDDAFFAECKPDRDCLRKGLFSGYWFEYKSQPQGNNWQIIDSKLEKFLADNVKPK